MKIHMIFMVVFLCLNFPASSQNLDKSVNLNIKSGQIYDVLAEISNQTGANFSYNSETINDEVVVRLSVTGERVVDVLQGIFQDSTLVFQEVGSHIVIQKVANEIKQIEKLNLQAHEQSFVELRGKIVDNSTFEPLPFANISIINQAVGTVSNANGEFSFKIPVGNVSDTIGVTYMGYQNKYIPLKQLTTQENLILLEKNYVAIQEVIIRHVDAKTLINNALEAKEVNYCTQPVIMTSFYRESVLKNNRYTAVTEALLDIYKTSYLSAANDQIRVYKSRNSIDPAVDTIMMKIKSGLNTILLLDVVKHNINFLDKSYLNYYKYKMVDIVTYDNNTAYKISVKPYYLEDFPQFEGFVYIDVNTFAIKGAEFAYSKKNLEQRGNSFVVRKSRSVKAKPVRAAYEIRYKEYQGVNHIHLVRTSLELKVRYKNKIFWNNFKTTIEMVVNEIETNNVDRFNRKEVTKPSIILSEQSSDYDESFWEEFNFIRPDAPLQEAIQEINKKLAALKTQNQD